MKNIPMSSVAIPLCLMSIGFILVGAIGYQMSPDWLSARQIQDQAHDLVVKPQYPAPPAGQGHIETENEQVCLHMPEVTGLKISTKLSCLTLPVQRTVLSGPETEANKAWQAKVDSIRAEYERAVQQEAARLSDRQRADLKSYVKDMIQISTGILGLISGIAAFAVGSLRGRLPNAKAGTDGLSGEAGDA